MVEAEIRGIRIEVDDGCLDAMRRLVAGQAPAEIAAALDIAPRTFRRRVSTLCAAIGAENQYQAVGLLVKAGLIEVE